MMFKKRPLCSREKKKKSIVKCGLLLCLRITWACKSQKLQQFKIYACYVVPKLRTGTVPEKRNALNYIFSKVTLKNISYNKACSSKEIKILHVEKEAKWIFEEKSETSLKTRGMPHRLQIYQLQIGKQAIPRPLECSLGFWSQYFF